MNIKIGDTAYYIDKWTDQVGDGVVMEIEPYQDTMIAVLKCNCEYRRKVTMYIADIFDTYDKAKEVRDLKEEVLKEEYRQLIPDIPSLIQFMFDKAVCICEESTDWTAREVAMEKAKELMNMEFSE